MAMKAHPKANPDRNLIGIDVDESKIFAESSALLSAAFAIPGCFAEEEGGLVARQAWWKVVYLIAFRLIPTTTFS